MQAIAAEMNLSETVFLRPLQNNCSFVTGNRFNIRWFTPTNEVPLCGHATVASAAVLFFALNNTSEEITFESLSGDLITKRDGSGITMNFPLNKPIQQDKDDYQKLLKLITSDENIKNVFYSPTTKKLLVRLDDSLSRNYLESLKPDISSMVPTEPSGKVKGIILTLKGSEQNGCVDQDGKLYDFISRYFAPWNGIDEDPVTGSAHTVSGPYWGGVLGKKTLYARQCSKRGGDVTMDMGDDGRIDLTGNAVIVMSGKLKV